MLSRMELTVFERLFFRRNEQGPGPCRRMGCNVEQRLFRREGQGSVEYALAIIAFLAVAIALGVLWHFVSEGNFAQDAAEALTHRIPWGVSDIVLF